MGFGHGKAGRFLLGKYDVSRFFKDWGGNTAIDLSEVTTLTKNSKCFVIGGDDGKVNLGGFFDGAAGAIQDILAEFKAAQASWPFMLCPAGYAAVGRRVFMGQGLLTTHEVAGSVSDAVTTNAELQANDSDDWGVCHADLAERNATTNCTAVDNGAATANGGCAVIHLTAFDSLDSVTGKIQHSDDNSTWADLVEFDDMADVDAAFAEVAAGTAVERYTRAVLTIAGTGTFTAAVGFARR